jgi:hypothetical protein
MPVFITQTFIEICITVCSGGSTQTTGYIPITKKQTAVQLKFSTLHSIIPASNMIDLTINKTPITSYDFQDNWRVVQGRKKESKQPINQIAITTKGNKVAN